MSKPVLTPRTNPFVGRELEIELLKETHASARQGGPGARRLALVLGGPGVGKSVLLCELGRTLRSRGELVFEGRCAPGVEQAYQPFAEIVTHAFASLEAMGVHGGALERYVARLEPFLPARRSPAVVVSKWQLYEALLEFLIEL